MSDDSFDEDEVVTDLEAVNDQPFAFDSLFFFPLDNKFRKFVIKLVKNK